MTRALPKNGSKKETALASPTAVSENPLIDLVIEKANALGIKPSYEAFNHLARVIKKSIPSVQHKNQLFKSIEHIDSNLADFLKVIVMEQKIWHSRTHMASIQMILLTMLNEYQILLSHEETIKITRFLEHDYLHPKNICFAIRKAKKQGVIFENWESLKPAFEEQIEYNIQNEPERIINRVTEKVGKNIKSK